MVFKKSLPRGVPDAVIQSTVTFSDNLPDFFENFLKGRDTSKYYCHPYEESGEHIPERYRETFLKARGQWVWENYLESLKEKTGEEVEPQKQGQPILYNSAHFVDEVGELDENRIEEQIFLMNHKFTRREFNLEVVPENGKDVKVAAVEALSSICGSRIASLESLAIEMKAMTRAASAVGLCGSAASELRLASEQCARVLFAQQKLEQYLQSVPSLDDTIRALAEYAHDTLEDTKAMISSWSAVHHSTADLGEIMIQQDQEQGQTVSAAAIAARKKSQKPLFFRRQKAQGVAASSEEETTIHQSVGALSRSQPEVVSNHWADQMRAFAALARAFKRTAMVTDRFSMLGLINGLARYNDKVIQPSYAAAKKVYISSKALRHLHQQIDYSNSTLTLPKGNALTTEEDRLAVHRSIGPLFARRTLPSDCTLIHESVLTEYIPSSSSSVSQDAKRLNKKRTTGPSPKEYRLIVTNGIIYFCEVIPAATTTIAVSKRIHSLKSVKAATAKKATSSESPRTSLRLVHEPVLVIDTQISSTPDIVHPQYGSHNIVMLCFYNETSYILQAKSAEDRDAWIKCARALDIEQPKPTPARRELDEKLEELYLASQVPIQATPSASAVDLAALASKDTLEPVLEGSSGRGWRSLGNCVKVVGRAFHPSKKSNCANGADSLGDEHLEEVGDEEDDELNHPEMKLFPIEGIPSNDQEKALRHFNMARCEVWDVPKVPVDSLMIRPTLRMMNARGGTYIHTRNAELTCTRSGQTVECEFGFGLEDSGDLQRLRCPIYTLHMPCRRNYGPRGPGEKRKDEEGNEYIAHPPEFIDCYGHGFLNPKMYIKFNVEEETISFLGLYIIKLQSSEMVQNFEKVYKRLISKFPIPSDNVLLEVDRSEVLQVFKKTVHPFTTLPEDEIEEHLEAGREWYPLGDCHLEFRRMSQYPKATCIGFLNPVTKRDHGNGVLLLDSKLSRDTAMALGPKWMNLLGQTNGYERVSATEMRLTLWQTNPLFKDRILYGVYICKQVIKYKSLEVYKIHGPANKLDSVQDFILSEMNRLTDAKTIEETLELASVAFQSHILDEPLVIESEQPIAVLNEKGYDDDSHPELVILKTASDVDDSLGEGEFDSHFSGGEFGSHFSGHRMDCSYLETVPEEDESASSIEIASEPLIDPSDEPTSSIEIANEPLIDPTATFFPESHVPEESEPTSSIEMSCANEPLIDPTATFFPESHVPEESEPTSSIEMSCANELLISSTATFFPESHVPEEEGPTSSIEMSCANELLISSTATFFPESHVPEEEGPTSSIETSCVDEPSISSTATFFPESHVPEEDEPTSSIDTSCVDEPSISSTATFFPESHVPEEDEPTSSIDTSCANEPLISSTATFFPKSQSALQLMYEEQQEQEENMTKGQPLTLDAPSFEDLSMDDTLSHFMEQSATQTEREEEQVAQKSVADLTKFWALTTKAPVTVQPRVPSTSITSPDTAVAKAQSEIAAKTQSEIDVVKAHNEIVVDKAHSEVVVVKARNEIVLVKVQNEFPTEIIQATRYLGKRRLTETGAVYGVEDRNKAEPGIDMEHTKPVQDLRRQWEAMHRHGI